MWCKKCQVEAPYYALDVCPKCGSKLYKNKYILKTVPYKAFIDAYNGYWDGKLSQKKAGEMCGLSAPTFMKYCTMVATGMELPEGLFYDD